MAVRQKPITFFVLSHKGLVRHNNEDYAAVQEIANFKGGKALLAVLADGVGGHKAGEVASRIAVDTIFKSMNNMQSSDPHFALDSAINNANLALLENMEKYPDHEGMGTTCVCTLIVENTLYAAHLGDSRLYLLRGRSLSQLTRDHTILQDYKHLTILHPDNLTRSHPLAHVISRYLGTHDSIEIDQEMVGIGQSALSLTLKSGDIILLCSDGLTDLLTDEEITHTILTCKGRKRTQSLVYRALEKGGHDNTTVIILNIP